MSLQAIKEVLIKLFKYLYMVWSNLPPETKLKILKKVETIWRPILEKFYDEKVKK